MDANDDRSSVRPAEVNRLLVPFDGSAGSVRAAPVARRLGARLGAPLTFVGVVAPDDDAGALAHAVDHAAQSDEAMTVDGHDTARAILEVAGRVPGTVLCLASHGRGRTAALLGSVAADLATRATDPMVVVGPNVPDDLGPIARVVACVDGSTASESALPAAAAWAAALRVPLSIVTVAEPVPEPVMSGTSSQRRHRPPHAPEGYLGAIAARWQGRGVDVTTAAVYDPVSVAGGLADHLRAGPTSLVAVATRGRSGLARLAHGSVAAAIVHQVPAPVLLVPQPR